jgi:hypothetical protein
MIKQRILNYFTLALLILACIDVFVWRYEPTSIKAGQSFVYWSHVEQTPRAWGFVIFLLFVGTYPFWHRLYFSWIRPEAALLLTLALFIFCLLAPIASITHIARHLQGSGSYQLYYQYEGIGDIDCDYVLVRCESFGLCEFVESWQVAPVCLGDQAPIRLEDNIRVFIHGELVFEE